MIVGSATIEAANEEDEILFPHAGKPCPRQTEIVKEVSKRMADEENLLTIPGDMFGAGQERFIRLAFANVTDDKIPLVLERLERFGV